MGKEISKYNHCFAVKLTAIASTLVIFSAFLYPGCLLAAPVFVVQRDQSPRCKEMMAQTVDKIRRVKFGKEHLQLIRNLSVVWIDCEAGAPAVDYDERYGSARVYEDMARILGLKKKKHLSSEEIYALDKLDESLSSDLCALFIQHAVISPGAYSIVSRMIDRYPDGKFKINDDGSGEMEFPMNHHIQFSLTDEHIKLLRRANWRWYGIDPKRPYGDMSYFYLDMADALSIHVSRDLSGTAKFSPEQIRKLDRLHGEMVFALQTLFQHGELEPCLFTSEGGAAWKISREEDLESDEAESQALIAEKESQAAESSGAQARKQIFGAFLDLFKSSKSQEDGTDGPIAASSTMLEKQPDNPLLYATRASYYKQAKRYDEAIEDYSKALELGKDQQLAYMWYEGRALVYDTLGKESEALADLNATINLQKEYLPAYYYRGRIYNNRNESEKALADFNRVISGNPNWNADVYYCRATAHLSLSNDLQAAKDFCFYLDSDRWQDRTAPYAVLLAYVAYRRAGLHMDAQALIKRASEKLKNLDSWPGLIIDYLVKNGNEERLLKSAGNNDDLTEAHFYLGTKLLFDGRVEDAEKHLRWVAEQGNKSFLDYHLAIAELEKLRR